MDELAQSWLLRPNPRRQGSTAPQDTMLDIAFLNSTRTICLLKGISGYTHTGVRDPRTGVVRVDISPTRTLADALTARSGRDAAIAHALSEDRNASPDDVQAAGWASHGHGALAFLHTNRDSPSASQSFLSQDPQSQWLFAEGLLATLRA